MGMSGRVVVVWWWWVGWGTAVWQTQLPCASLPCHATGKEPLLYVLVLLLSLQFRCAPAGIACPTAGCAAACACGAVLLTAQPASYLHPLTSPPVRHLLLSSFVLRLTAEMGVESKRVHGGLAVCCCPLRRGAVAFLAQEASTREYRLDAVHLGICLHHAGVLGISGDADAGAHARGRAGGTGAWEGKHACMCVGGVFVVVVEGRGGGRVLCCGLRREAWVDLQLCSGLCCGLVGPSARAWPLRLKQWCSSHPLQRSAMPPIRRSCTLCML